MKRAGKLNSIRCTAFVAAVTALCHFARADTIHLKKGGRIIGVISSEGETSIEIKSGMGTIILSRGAIAKIDRSTPEENSALEAQWQKEKEDEKEKVRQAKRYEEEQRAKGMVRYEGTWMPAEKAYEIEKGFAKQKEEWEKAFEQQKKELQDMERRLREMEARLEQRQRDQDLREQQIAIREQNLLLQQQNIQRQSEQIGRERQERPPRIFAVPRIEVFPPPSGSSP